MEDQLVVDDHGKRSPFDALSLSDMSVSGELTRSHVSAARSMVTASTQSYRWSNQELRDFVESYYSAIDFSYVHLLSRSSKAHITTATLAAVISRAYYHESHDRLVEFCEMIYTGKVTDDQDTAALRLRDWLLGQQGRASGTGGSMRVAIYRRAQRAVAAFCKRKPLAKLYAANEELYPIPHNGHV